jgi:predicted nucleic acid-binding protein
MLQVDEALFAEGWQYFQQHSDKSYSLTDCISFIVMQRLSIPVALTFDRHFSQAGLQKVP